MLDNLNHILHVNFVSSNTFFCRSVYENLEKRILLLNTT